MLDRGAWARAVDIALGYVGAARSPEQTPSAAVTTNDVDALALELANTAPVVTRVARLSPRELCRSATDGGVLLARVGGGWLVATARHGVRVGAGQEGRVTLSARTVRALAEAELIDCIVVEPQLPLEGLSVREVGSKSPWARLRGFAGLESSLLIALVVYAVLVGGLSLAVPIAVQVLVNTIAFGALLQPLVVLTALLLCVLSFAGALQLLEWYAIEVLQRRVFVRVAEDFARRLVSLPSEAHDAADVPLLVRRFFEVVSLQKAAGKLLLDGLGLALQTLVGLLLLGFYHPVLLAFDVAMVMCFVGVLALGYGAVPTAITESYAKYRTQAWLENMAGASNLLTRDSAALFAVQRADDLTRDYLRARRRHFARVLRQGVGGVVVQVVAMGALLGLGGWLVMKGELTLGQLVAAELVLGAVGAGFAKLGQHFEAGYDVLAGLDKLGGLVDLDARFTLLAAFEEPLGGLELSGLEFGRAGALRWGPLDARMPKGARVATALGRGAETSALLEVLAGLRRPTGGALRMLDGEAILVSAMRLRARALLVRRGELMPGTILDNLRLMDPGLSEGSALKALRAVELTEAVARLEQGLYTPLRKDGAPLNRFEAARLCLARAVVAQPDWLLVDGLFDDLGLDEKEEGVVLERFLGPQAPWSVVLESDRPAVLAYCEQRLGSRGEAAR